MKTICRNTSSKLFLKLRLNFNFLLEMVTLAFRFCGQILILYIIPSIEYNSHADREFLILLLVTPSRLTLSVKYYPLKSLHRFYHEEGGDIKSSHQSAEQSPHPVLYMQGEEGLVWHRFSLKCKVCIKIVDILSLSQDTSSRGKIWSSSLGFVQWLFKGT